MGGSGLQAPPRLSQDQAAGGSEAMEELQFQNSTRSLSAKRALLLQGGQCGCGLAAGEEHSSQLVSRALAAHHAERPGVRPRTDGREIFEATRTGPRPDRFLRKLGCRLL